MVCWVPSGTYTRCRADKPTALRPNTPTMRQGANEPSTWPSSEQPTDHQPNNQQVGYAIRHQASGIRHRGISHRGINIHIHNANWRCFCVLSSMWPSLCLSCVCFVDFTDFSLSLSLFTALFPTLSLSLSLLSFSFVAVAVAVGNFLALLTFHFVGMENFILHYCKGSWAENKS